MHESTAVAPVWTVGLDIGDRVTHVCVLDAAGRIVERARVATTVAAMTRWAARPAARVVLEAGTHSPWLSRVLAAAGHAVVVAQARQVRLIYQGPRKSDRVDAETLARLGRVDPALLAPIQHRGAAAQQHLALLRSRDAVVRTRTLLINHLRGTVKAWGARVPACSAPQVARQSAAALPAALQAALAPVVELVGTLTATIQAYDRQVEQLALTQYPETARLRQVQGVGALTALAYVLTLEDPARFRRSRHVGPYLGLCPKRAQSSAHDPEWRPGAMPSPRRRRPLPPCVRLSVGLY